MQCNICHVRDELMMASVLLYLSLGTCLSGLFPLTTSSSGQQSQTLEAVYSLRATETNSLLLILWRLLLFEVLILSTPMFRSTHGIFVCVWRFPCNNSRARDKRLKCLCEKPFLHLIRSRLKHKRLAIYGKL